MSEFWYIFWILVGIGTVYGVLMYSVSRIPVVAQRPPAKPKKVRKSGPPSKVWLIFFRVGTVVYGRNNERWKVILVPNGLKNGYKAWSLQSEWRY